MKMSSETVGGDLMGRAVHAVGELRHMSQKAQMSKEDIFMSADYADGLAELLSDLIGEESKHHDRK